MPIMTVEDEYFVIYLFFIFVENIACLLHWKHLLALNAFLLFNLVVGAYMCLQSCAWVYVQVCITNPDCYRCRYRCRR